MAEKAKITNVCTKLALARLKFQQMKASKSGKNIKLEFKYFELEDIVPPATQIFAELNLIHVVRFQEGVAEMIVMDAENPEDALEFSLPFREIDPIVSSKTGNSVMNSVQALGATITYYRRYLWMLALDVVEADSIDAAGPRVETPKEEPKPAEKPVEKPAKASKPKTAAERKQITAELTDPNGQADELQIKALKKACKELIELDPDDEKYANFVKALSEKTAKFTKISKKDCDAIIANIEAMKKEIAKGAEKA